MWDELCDWVSGLAPEKWMVLGCGVTIALVATAFIASPVLKNLYQAWQIRSRVGRMGHEIIAGARIPDGVGRALYIDYLVRGDRGIIVIGLRRYPGVIFAAENMESWVQLVGKVSHKFPNPLPELHMQVAAVRALVPDVSVQGVLLFGHGSQFPKGRPAEVLTLDDLELGGAAADGDAGGAALESGWERLRLQNNELATVDADSRAGAV